MAIKNGKLVDSEQNTLYVETKASLLINDDGTKWSGSAFEIISKLPQPNYYLSLKNKFYLMGEDLYYLVGSEGSFTKQANSNNVRLGYYGYEADNIICIGYAGTFKINSTNNEISQVSIEKLQNTLNVFSQIGDDIYFLSETTHKKYNVKTNTSTTIQLNGLEGKGYRFQRYIAVGDKIYIFGAYYNLGSDKKVRVYEPSTGNIIEYGDISSISNFNYVNIKDKIYWADNDLIEYDINSHTITKKYKLPGWWFQDLFTDGNNLYSMDNNNFINKFNFILEEFVPIAIPTIGESLNSFIFKNNKVFALTNSNNNLFIIDLMKNAKWKKITTVDVE